MSEFGQSGVKSGTSPWYEVNDMARKRTSKRRSTRRRRRGMGSVITVRRARGMGALKGTTGAVIAPLVGGAITALATLGVRQYVDPAQGETQRSAVKWAWLIGWGSGLVGSLALYFLGGSKEEKMRLAASSAVAATAVGLGFYGYDMVLEGKAQDIVATLQMESGAAAAAAASSAAASQGSAQAGGMGAIVYQQLSGANGMGAIVPEYGMNGLGSPFGQNISLRGVDPSVFGSSPF